MSIDIGPIYNPSNGHAYYRLTPSNWTNAESEAISLGGHLVTINDAQENDWVFDTFAQHGQYGLWLGLNDVANEGQFVWSSGELVTFTDWASDQPDNFHFSDGVDEDHVEFVVEEGGQVSYRSRNWNDFRNDAYENPYNSTGGVLQGIVEVILPTDDPAPLTDLQFAFGGTSVIFDGFNQLNVYYTIANTAATPFEIGFYRSEGSGWDAGDALLSTVTISDPVDLTVGQHLKTYTLGTGAGQVRVPGIGAPELDTQDYYLLAVLDPTDAIAEDDAEISEDNIAALMGAYRPGSGVDAPVYVHGTSGNDTFVVTYSGANIVLDHSHGGAPSSTHSYPAASVTGFRIRTHGDNDIVNASAVGAPLAVWTGSGDDQVVGGSGPDLIYNSFGNDPINPHGSDTLSGGPGDDVIFGGDVNDVIFGGPGNDEFQGGLGDDEIRGEDGNDTLHGGFGTDTLYGGSGNDLLIPNEDTLLDDGSPDLAYGEDGDDAVGPLSLGDFADGGSDVDLAYLYATTGADTIDLTNPIALINGGPIAVGFERYFAHGLDGNDTILGGALDDILVGGIGNDLLVGGAGNDALEGSDGDDILDGGSGHDTFIGGGGTDRFRFREEDAVGQGVVHDFTDGIDRIDLSAYPNLLFNDILAASVQSGADTVITLPSGKSIRLVNFALVNLDATDFVGSHAVVTNTNDSGPGSLRQAILLANQNLGPDVLTFQIGSGPQTIQPSSQLPTITDTLTIDASTQPGYAGTPLIKLDGSSAGGSSHGLDIRADSSVIKGLSIIRFAATGIHIESADHVTVQSNLIGLDASGAPGAGNQAGIDIAYSTGALIGGPEAAQANTIAYNFAAGISIYFASGNTIQGNTVADNVNYGISIDSGQDNAVRANSIHGNLFPIALRNGNNNQPSPVLTQAITTGNQTSVEGVLQGAPNTVFDLEFFSNLPADLSGPSQGRTYVGTTSVTTDTQGNATFIVSITATDQTGQFYSATATDPAGNTSEFSNTIGAPTKFYVVNDAAGDRTFEYGATGGIGEDYALNAGNTAPRGVASASAGDRVWVVDANKNVYVYDTAGALLGSWTAGSLGASPSIQGIATNGTDIWIVDTTLDKVSKYAGAASRLSGSQTATSSFLLNSGNKKPTDIVAANNFLWVVNDGLAADKVFKYRPNGTLLGSWTINGAGTTPTGITVDPNNVSNIWIVDNGTDRVYQFDNSASRISGSQSPATSFALAAGNGNAQGIADPTIGGAGATFAEAQVPAPRSRGRSTSHDSTRFDLAIDELSRTGSTREAIATDLMTDVARDLSRTRRRVRRSAR